MLDERVKFALDNFLQLEPKNTKKKPYKISFSALSYEMLELSNDEKDKLILNAGTENSLCVTNYDDIPKWGILQEGGNLSIRKCIAHFVLRKNLDHWELHMIEMKRTIGSKTWNNVKEKVRASYFTIKALSTFLGISLRDKDIFIYTAYGFDKTDLKDKNPEDKGMSLRQKTGEPATDFITEWKGNHIYVNLVNQNGEEIPVKFSHTRIEMNEESDGWLKGYFSLATLN